eukprot:g15727.t1
MRQRMLAPWFQELVESKMCKAMGHCFDTRVIYGDTDSVMLTLGGTGGTASMEDAFAVGKEAWPCELATLPPSQLATSPKIRCPAVLNT